ncbi:MAG TPA: hypothetical protein VHS58_21010 [Acetobacteraceae bacterium]|nr:hypothetical protein [Acetobacteraceae bacterium]
MALVLLTVAAQAVSIHRDQGDVDPLRTLVARLEALGLQTQISRGSDIVQARESRCDEPVLASVLSIYGSDDGKLSDLLTPDRRASFVFLGGAGARPAPAALVARYAWQTILFTIGIRRDKPSSRMAVVTLPTACNDLANHDWSALSPS